MAKYIILYGTSNSIKGTADTLLEAVKIQGAEKDTFAARIYKEIDYEVSESDMSTERSE